MDRGIGMLGVEKPQQERDREEDRGYENRVATLSSL
jgi:hypothetical protein